MELKLLVQTTVFAFFLKGINSNFHLDFPEFLLDRFIKHTLQCNNVAGLSISLVNGDRAVFSRGYGHTDVEKNIKATEHSEFSIGSLTKAFTSTIIADILSKHDNLTWDTPIREILGHTFKLCDNIRTNHVTMRDLLAHRVGIPSNFNALLVGFPATMTKAELVQKLQYMPASSDFRNKFHYSNYMYMLAGHVAEVLTGESWESLVTNRLLKKLRMHSTNFVDKLPNLENLASPYVLQNGSLRTVDKTLLLTVSPSGPAGSITSTASDMAKWMQFHLNKGRNMHGTTLVDETQLAETYKSQMANPFGENDLSLPTYPISDTCVSYNMGWMSSSYRGYRKLWHSGGIVTYSSQLWMFPDMNSGVFIVSSGPVPAQAIKNIAFYASDLLLGLDPWLNLSTTCTFPSPWAEPDSTVLASQEIQYKWNITRQPRDYEGVYGHMGFGEITLISRDSQHLELHYGRFGKMELYPINETHFIGYYLDKLWYVTNSDGRTSPYTIKFGKQNDKITQILYPIDFNDDLTVFLKGDYFNSQTQKPQSFQCFTSTSSLCDSGLSAASCFVYSHLTTVLLICSMSVFAFFMLNA